VPPALPARSDDQHRLSRRAQPAPEPRDGVGKNVGWLYEKSSRRREAVDSVTTSPAKARASAARSATTCSLYRLVKDVRTGTLETATSRRCHLDGDLDNFHQSYLLAAAPSKRAYHRDGSGQPGTLLPGSLSWERSDAVPGISRNTYIRVPSLTVTLSYLLLPPSTRPSAVHDRQVAGRLLWWIRRSRARVPRSSRASSIRMQGALISTRPTSGRRSSPSDRSALGVVFLPSSSSRRSCR
jgi:hypothetical protein